MAKLESLVAQPLPIQKDGDGALRVGGTRVRLETVLVAFKNGCAAEEIFLKYPSLNLKDIYAVITYYLWHPKEMEQFLQDRTREAEKIRQEIEAIFPPSGVRERL